MLDGFRYRRALKRLQKDRAFTQAAFKRDIELAYKNKEGGDRIRELEHGEFFEVYTLDQQIALLQTRRLRSIAEKRLIPVPPFDKDDKANWEEADQLGKWTLTHNALAALNAAIRQDTKQRVELWLAGLAALTGVLGTLIGLVSVLKGGG